MIHQLPPLRGSLAALPTPFEDGKIDAGTFGRLCERHLSHGTSALIVCGSTGEAAAMQPEEQADAVAMAAAIVEGRVPVIAGCGGQSTEAAAAVGRLAARAGADALLCAPTPYVKPSQAGIIAHVSRIAEASGLPVVVYDIPGRAGVSIANETIAELYDRGLIAGVKDATADLGRPPRLKTLCGEGLAQLSGDDATAAAYRAAGGHGCISVTANLVPLLCARLHSAWDRGDLAAFAALRDRLAPLHDALFLETNPVPLKAALALMGFGSAEVRLPLIEASQAIRGRFQRILPQVMDADAAFMESAHAAA